MGAHLPQNITAESTMVLSKRWAETARPEELGSSWQQLRISSNLQHFIDCPSFAPKALRHDVGVTHVDTILLNIMQPVVPDSW